MSNKRKKYVHALERKGDSNFHPAVNLDPTRTIFSVLSSSIFLRLLNSVSELLSLPEEEEEEAFCTRTRASALPAGRRSI